MFCIKSRIAIASWFNGYAQMASLVIVWQLPIVIREFGRSKKGAFHGVNGHGRWNAFGRAVIGVAMVWPCPKLVSISTGELHLTLCSNFIGSSLWSLTQNAKVPNLCRLLSGRLPSSTWIYIADWRLLNEESSWGCAQPPRFSDTVFCHCSSVSAATGCILLHSTTLLCQQTVSVGAHWLHRLIFNGDSPYLHTLCKQKQRFKNILKSPNVLDQNDTANHLTHLRSVRPLRPYVCGFFCLFTLY